MNIPKIIIDFDSCCNTCHNSLTVVPSLGGCGCRTVALPCRPTTPNSPCVECEDVCDESISTECSLYSAGNIPQLDIKTDDKLTNIIIKLAAEIISLKQRVAILEA